MDGCKFGSRVKQRLFDAGETLAKSLILDGLRKSSHPTPAPSLTAPPPPKTSLARVYKAVIHATRTCLLQIKALCRSTSHLAARSRCGNVPIGVGVRRLAGKPTVFTTGKRHGNLASQHAKRSPRFLCGGSCLFYRLNGEKST